MCSTYLLLRKNIAHTDWKNQINFGTDLSTFEGLLSPDHNFLASHMRLHYRICKATESVGHLFMIINSQDGWMQLLTYLILVAGGFRRAALPAYNGDK